MSTVEGRELGLVPVIEGRGGTWSGAGCLGRKLGVASLSGEGACSGAVVDPEKELKMGTRDGI